MFDINPWILLPFNIISILLGLLYIADGSNKKRLGEIAGGALLLIGGITATIAFCLRLILNT